MAPHCALPRRPLTVGELLDAAAQLVRGRGRALLAAAVGLACVEQAVLYPLRSYLGADYLSGLRYGFWQTFGAMWSLMAIGCGLEAFIITLLGTRAGLALAHDLTGTPAAGRQLLRPRWSDAGTVLLVAPLAGLATGLAAFVGPFWILGYSFFGMAGAAMGLERRGPFSALARAAGAGFANGLRAVWVRMLGYSAWLLLRLGFFFGMLALLNLLNLRGLNEAWVLIVGFVIANSAAYAFLAALDAATLAEGRFRREGLDIWLSRSEKHSALTPESLAAR